MGEAATQPHRPGRQNESPEVEIFGAWVAESEGFEPSNAFWTLHDFQSCSFGHSDNSPGLHAGRGEQKG